MYYIGIDVHKKKCVTTIKGDAKKIYAVVITDDKCGDSPQFEELVQGQAFANAEKSPNAGTSADAGIAAGGAYDTKNIRSYCNEHEINPLIPVCIDFAGNANGCMPRKEAGFRQLGGFAAKNHIDKKTEHGFADLTREQKRELQKAWRKESGYNDRWAVEIACSERGTNPLIPVRILQLGGFGHISAATAASAEPNSRPH